MIWTIVSMPFWATGSDVLLNASFLELGSCTTLGMMMHYADCQHDAFDAYGGAFV